MSDREFLARKLVAAFNLNGPDFDHVSEMHRAAAYRMADAVEGFYSERLGAAEAERDYYKGECENAQAYWRVETNLAKQAEARAEARIKALEGEIVSLKEAAYGED